MDKLDTPLGDLISQSRTEKKSDSFASKSCFTCQKTGHIAKNCPDKRGGNTGGFRAQGGSFECFVCGGRGHLARDCPTPRDRPNRFESKGACHTCGATGHFARDCNQNESVNARPSRAEGACHTCGETGHFARDCPDNEHSGDVCYKCQRPGHIARDCRSRGDSRDQGQACYTCGRVGHRARDCRNARARSRSPGYRGGRTRGRGGRDADCRVYVGNLSWQVSWQDLKDHMKNAGGVVHADILMNRDNRPSGGGIVTYTSPREARAAIEQLTDTELDGRKIFVREDREN